MNERLVVTLGVSSSLMIPCFIVWGLMTACGEGEKLVLESEDEDGVKNDYCAGEDTSEV